MKKLALMLGMLLVAGEGYGQHEYKDFEGYEGFDKSDSTPPALSLIIYYADINDGQRVKIIDSDVRECIYVAPSFGVQATAFDVEGGIRKINISTGYLDVLSHVQALPQPDVKKQYSKGWEDLGIYNPIVPNPGVDGVRSVTVNYELGRIYAMAILWTAFKVPDAFYPPDPIDPDLFDVSAETLNGNFRLRPPTSRRVFVSPAPPGIAPGQSCPVPKGY